MCQGKLHQASLDVVLVVYPVSSCRTAVFLRDPVGLSF